MRVARAARYAAEAVASADQLSSAMPAAVAALPEREIGQASRMLAEAFRDNPLNVAVIGGSARRRTRCNEAGMRQVLPAALRHGIVLRAGGDRPSGVGITIPPYAYPLPPPSLLAQLWALLIQGSTVRTRWRQVFEHLDRLHPRDPHWYLATLGVAPDAQGRGLGRALLRALLARADDDALPCYLETDRPENVAFYEASGFSVSRRSRVLGVRVWHMLRPAEALQDGGSPGRV